MRVVYLANYEPHALKGIMEGSDRDAAVRTLVESLGGTLESTMLCRGVYDVIVIATMPNQAAALGIAMAVRASGSVSDVVVLEELDTKPIVAAANTAAKAYKPAG